jgi:Tfp pilus assembly protein PilF
VLGLEHLHTLASVDNLGWVLSRQGEYEEAEAMHPRALEGLGKVLRPEHPAKARLNTKSMLFDAKLCRPITYSLFN